MKKLIIVFVSTFVVLAAVVAILLLRGAGGHSQEEAQQDVLAAAADVQTATEPAVSSAVETETPAVKADDTKDAAPAAADGQESAPAANETDATGDAAPAEDNARDTADAAAADGQEAAAENTETPASADAQEVPGTDAAADSAGGTGTASPGGTETRLVFTGDVELSDSVLGKYNASGISGVLSDRLHSVLYGADVLMINNEFCFSLGGVKQDKQFTFRIDPAYVRILTDMGVDIAGLANNHVMDYGKEALVDTFATLTDAGIDFTGSGNTLEEASKLVIRTAADGRKIGFLAAGHVIPTVDWNITVAQPGEFCFYDETLLLQAIEAAKQQVDLLFVMVHWGLERTITPTDYQVTDGHRFIDAGADAVIGMHSHCLQPIEFYNGKPVFYSLGNFVFNRTIGSGGGGCVEVIIPNGEPPRYRILPTFAADALTDIDENGFHYIESISRGITVDPEGNVTPVSAE